MKTNLLLLAIVSLGIAACDTRVNVPPADKSTTIVNPPAPQEKKTETTVTKNPDGSTVEKKTETKQ